MIRAGFTAWDGSDDGKQLRIAPVTGSSRSTLGMAQQFAAIRAVGDALRTASPEPQSIDAVIAASQVAADLYKDPTAGDDDAVRRKAAYLEFRLYVQRELMPCLEDHFLDALAVHRSLPKGAPAASASGLDLARCLIAVDTLAGHVRGTARLGPELARRVQDHSHASRDLLASPEPADLPLLAANHRVIDEMLEVLVLLRDADSSALIRQHARILARATLVRVAATLEDFLGSATLETRFDMATVLAATDDLLIIARKVIEGVGEEYDPIAERYADNLGMEALRRFAGAILAIEQQTLRQCVIAVGQAQVSADVLAASLLMLVKLHGLGRAILDGCRAGTVAVGAARAMERAEQLLRPRAMVQGIEYMAQQMDRLLAGRTRDGSEAAQRGDAYVVAFEHFKAQTGLLHAP